MKKSAGGFTLIELVAVMVILAILAVVAVPQFVDMRNEAAQAAVDGVAGSLSSASALNYAKEMADSTKGVAVANCTDAQKLLQGYDTATSTGGLPTGYIIGAAAITAGESENCTITGPAPQSKTAIFVAIGVN